MQIFLGYQWKKFLFLIAVAQPLCHLLATPTFLALPQQKTLSHTENIPTKKQVSHLIESHTQTAFSLYSTIETPNANLVFSPYSISSCLSMVFLGARGNTESQMQKVLNIDSDRQVLAKSSDLLWNTLLPSSKQEKTYQLKIANALWVSPEIFLLADFRYAVQKQFKASISKVDFSTPSEATTTINGWTAEQTEGKIKKLLEAEDIDVNTRLVLTSSIYFSGNWKHSFDARSTQDWPFNPTPDLSLNVRMMDQTLFLPYFENNLIQMAALPFEGETQEGTNLAFLILLPKSASHFPLVLKELPSEFDQWVSSLSSQRVDLKLPKFTLDTRIHLQKPLEDLGMVDAFNSSANFTGMDGMRDLFLNKVIHQTFFSLDENGVTAASATAASMNVTSIPDKTPPIALTADHPFLFFIVDLKSKEMLFMGKIYQP